MQVSLSPEALKVVKALMQQAGSTMFMTLLAVWQLLLARHCGPTEDICVGVPVAGRNCGEAEALVGAFLGAVGVRTDLSGAPSFGEVMQRVRKVGCVLADWHECWGWGDERPCVGSLANMLFGATSRKFTCMERMSAVHQ